MVCPIGRPRRGETDPRPTHRRASTVEPPPNLDTSQYSAWLAATRKRIGDGDQIEPNAFAGELVSKPKAIEAVIAKLRADLTA